MARAEYIEFRDLPGFIRECARTYGGRPPRPPIPPWWRELEAWRRRTGGPLDARALLEELAGHPARREPAWFLELKREYDRLRSNRLLRRRGGVTRALVRLEDSADPAGPDLLIKGR